MTVLVAIPYYRCEAFVAKAVRSALAQTYRDIVVMVAGDGDDPRKPLRDIDDPRLRVIVFSHNGGAPHVQQAMLLGNPYKWYAPWGADDWADPEYLERLLALGGEANCTGTFWFHRFARVEQRTDRQHGEYGVFRSDLLRSVGGYGVERRCGQDTLMVDLIGSVTDIRWSTEPTFHKLRRNGSLTDPGGKTGHNSPYRREVRRHNAEVLAACRAIGFDDLAAIRAYRRSLVPQESLDSLDGRARAVRKALAA